MPLIVRVIPMPAVTVVTVAGEIDIATDAQLRRQLRTVPDRDAIVELSGVELLSAAGLTVLLELRHRLARADAQLVLVAAPAHVRRVLTLTGLDAGSVVLETVEDAVTWISARTARGRTRLTT